MSPRIGLSLAALLIGAGSVTAQEKQTTDVPPLPMTGPPAEVPMRTTLTPEESERLRRLSQIYDIKIDPKTPAKDLLPAPPKTKPPIGPLATADLIRVFEIEYESGPPAPPEKTVEWVASQVAKARALEGKSEYGFVRALREHRPDLAGLPFENRADGVRGSHFSTAAREIRRDLAIFGSSGRFPFRGVALFSQVQLDRASLHERDAARIDVLMQELADESPEMKLGLVKHLGGIDLPEATMAIAKLALYSDDDEVRSAAVEALRPRKPDDYTSLLMHGFKHPYAPVAKRAAEAIAKLKRIESVSDLVAVLREPDPRSPEVRKLGGTTGPIVRELVRVNHMKSCLLCHAPESRDRIGSEERALIPIPGEKLIPRSRDYYSFGSPDLSIRFDVTYLKQDFSAKLPVADHGEWPEEQRFDFLVRERLLTEKEAEAFTAELKKRNAGGSPYHLAAVAALNELTEKKLTADEWRKSVKIPASARSG
jgi:hypothetical protein